MKKIQLFFERIGLPKDTQIEKAPEFLKKIHYACVTAIAYENIDILNGVQISLNADDIFDKIVIRKRGGYCFELNALLSYMLKEMGFTVVDHFARFVRGEAETPMRRHRILTVECEDSRYMCDIGVGQIAPRYPVKLTVGIEQRQFGEGYKFEYNNEFGWVLYDDIKGEWMPYISFTEEKQYEVDFIQPSFYCEKHPDSPFTKNYMLSIKTADGRKTLDGTGFKIFKGTELVSIENDLSIERIREIFENEFFIFNY